MNKLGQHMNKLLASTCLAVTVLAVSAALAVPASASDASDVDGALDRAFAAYVGSHPGDWTGAAQLVHELGGTMVISGVDGAVTTPEAATAAFRAMDNKLSPLLRGSRRSPGMVTPMSWPTDAYTVAVAVVTSGPTDSTVSLAGAWNFRDDFLGQGAPVDIAALLINKNCGTWGTYSSSTYTYTNASTNRGSLRSGGVGTSGPVWNISDYISNFRSYADHGTVSAVYNRTGCSSVDKTTIQGEFVYEGNDGGSVLGVSAGWGGFGVSYSNPGSTMTKSSGARTVPY